MPGAIKSVNFRRGKWNTIFRVRDAQFKAFWVRSIWPIALRDCSRVKSNTGKARRDETNRLRTLDASCKPQHKLKLIEISTGQHRIHPRKRRTILSQN